MSKKEIHQNSRRKFILNSTLVLAGLTFNQFPFVANDEPYTFLSISELSVLIRNKKVSPVEITLGCLQRIEQLDITLNAFITVTREKALKDAKKAELEIKKGKWKGPLHGIPISLKDNIDTSGTRTTAASGVYKERIPTEDAELVKKLKRAGAIIVGKTNLHEFALGTTSQVSYFGAVRNPWNKEYIAGGSSGGSAVAVAAGMCYAAIGTDTGGSNRLPASCTGIVGLKPTYSLISTRGIIPVIHSIDHAGIFTRNVQDAALVLSELTTSFSFKNSDISFFDTYSKRKFSIGIAQNFKASEEIRRVFKNCIDLFQRSGFEIQNIDLPEMPSDFNLGDAEIELYHRPLMNQFANQYQAATLKTLDSSKKINHAEYAAQKLRMQKARANISKLLFKNVDAVILPTVVEITPTLIEAEKGGPFALDDSNTFIFNYYGLPAVSIPAGFDFNGNPIGLQIVGPALAEAKVLEIAYRFEQISEWHSKHPVI